MSCLHILLLKGAAIAQLVDNGAAMGLLSGSRTPAADRSCIVFFFMPRTFEARTWAHAAVSIARFRSMFRGRCLQPLRCCGGICCLHFCLTGPADKTRAFVIGAVL